MHAASHLDKKCQAIRLILSDVDGVLTDGGITFDNQGIETKTFHVRDGQGIKFWQRAGHTFGLLTARSSHIVQLRANELGIELVRQGVQDKLAALKQITEDLELELQEVCYVGDDLADLAALRQVGLSITVADACTDALQTVDYVTESLGGRGAIREVVEMVLKHQNRWNDLVKKYSGS